MILRTKNFSRRFLSDTGNFRLLNTEISKVLCKVAVEKLITERDFCNREKCFGIIYIRFRRVR